MCVAGGGRGSKKDDTRAASMRMPNYAVSFIQFNILIERFLKISAIVQGPPGLWEIDKVQVLHAS